MKQITMKFATIVTFFLITIAALNAQKSNWLLFQPNDSGTNVVFSNANSAIGDKYIKPINPSTNQPFASYLALNAQTDRNGKLLFYIISTMDTIYIMSNNNELIAKTSGNDNSPIIVPLPDGLRFHLILGSKLIQINLKQLLMKKYAEIQDDLDNLTGNSSISSGFKINRGADNRFISVAHKRSVQILKANCDSFEYNIYSISGNLSGIPSREIICDNVLSLTPDKEIQISKNKYHSNITNNIKLDLNYSIGEMEISPNGNELLATFKDAFLLSDINQSSISQISTISLKNKIQGLDSGFYICGAEYINDTQIIFSIYGTYDTTTTEQGLYIFNKNTGNMNKINGSIDFKYSFIEKGNDQKIYFYKEDGIYYLNSNLDTFVMVNNSPTNMTPTVPFIYLSVGQEFETPWVQTYYLPNQIDNYNNSPLLDINQVVSNKNILSPSMEIISPALSNTQIHLNSSHSLTGARKGTIYVLDTLTVSNIAESVVFDSLTIKFYQNAVLRIIGGADLEIKGSTLMGTCGSIWEGVQMIQNETHDSRIVCRKNIQGRNTKIRDAKIGIKTRNFFHSLNISDSTVFMANKIGIELNHADSYFTSITNSYFYDTAKLNDTSITQAAIRIINSDVKIGNLDSLPVKIIGGLNGIDAIQNKGVEITNAQIDQCKFGIKSNHSNKLKINNSILYNNEYAGINIKNSNFTNIVKSKLTQFQGSNGIEIDAALATNIKIGGILTDSNNITTEKGIGISITQNITPLYFHVNQNSYLEWPLRPSLMTFSQNHNLFIQNNRINGGPESTGIKVCRSNSKNQYSTFDTLLISLNKINSNEGIAIININTNEQNKMLPTHSLLSQSYGERHISRNEIVLRINSNPDFDDRVAKGINIENSKNIYCVNNSIKTIGLFIHPIFNNHNGISILNSPNTLIYNDSIFNCHNGIHIEQNNQFTNIYCNYLSHNFNSIVLNKSILRNKNLNNIFSNFFFDLYHLGSKLANGNLISRDNKYHFLWWNFNIFNNDNLKEPLNNIWILENTTKSHPQLLSKPANNSFIHNQPGTSACLLSIQTQSNPQNLDSLLNEELQTNDEIETFWNNYTLSKLMQPNNNNNNTFANGLLNLENTIDTGTISQMTNALLSSTPQYPHEYAIIDIYRNWMSYISKYDTIVYQMNQFTNVPIWNNDSTINFNNSMIDTSFRIIQYSSLSDSIVHRLDSIAYLSPTKTNPASFFARNLLRFMGFNKTYYDSAIKESPSLSGRVTANCQGGGTSGLIVKLWDIHGNYTGLSSITGDFGYFRIPGTQILQLDTNVDYFIRVYLPNDTNHISISASIKHLVFDSLLNIDCIFPGPNPLNIKTKSEYLTIYPNPCDEKLNVSNVVAGSNYLFEILSIEGSCLKTGKLDDQNTTIETRNIPNGMHILKLTNQNNQESRSFKLIIIHH
jgi:hypothetical protein